MKLAGVYSRTARRAGCKQSRRNKSGVEVFGCKRETRLSEAGLLKTRENTGKHSPDPIEAGSWAVVSQPHKIEPEMSIHWPNCQDGKELCWRLPWTRRPITTPRPGWHQHGTTGTRPGTISLDAMPDGQSWATQATGGRAFPTASKRTCF